MKNDYPRFLFHHGKASRSQVVYSEDQETALGHEWTRTISASEWAEPRPKDPEPEPELPDDDEENDNEDEEDDFIAKAEPAKVAAPAPVPRKRAPMRRPPKAKARKR